MLAAATLAAGGCNPSCNPKSPDCNLRVLQVSLALLDPWDGAAMGALTEGAEVDVLLLDPAAFVGNDLPLTAFALATKP